MKFTSTYKNSDTLKQFTVTLDRNNLSYSAFSDVKTLFKNSKEKTGFQVFIQNISQEHALEAVELKNRKDIEQKFASYWINYPDFTISFNANKLDFESLIKNKDSTDFLLQFFVSKI